MCISFCLYKAGAGLPDVLGGFGIATRLHQAALRLNACLLGQWGGQILRANGPNGLTAVAGVAERVVNAGIEDEASREVRIACVERRRPVVAELACAAKTRIVATTGSGQENKAICVTGLVTCYFITGHTVKF